MTQAIGSGQDPALAPAAAAARGTDAGIEATRKALDQQELEGREAVHLIESAGAASGPPGAAEARGAQVDRVA